MEWVSIVGPLVPTLIDIVKDAIVASKGDEQMAIGILMGVLGASEENKTRAAIVLARAKVEQELG